MEEIFCAIDSRVIFHREHWLGDHQIELNYFKNTDFHQIDDLYFFFWIYRQHTSEQSI